jgi:DNA polymerase III subunit delta'
VQSHPDVLIIPPDPPQNMIKVDQVRHVTETLHFLPSQGTKKIYIFTESCFMKEAANALLKALEEPPDFAYLFLLTRNAGELLATIRSRCITFRLAPLAAGELEQVLARKSPDVPARQRALIARLSEGGCGRAQSFDLEAHSAIVEDALLLLSSADRADHTSLFRATETYRAGAEGAEKMQALLRVLYALLQDLSYLKSGAKNLVRNVDRLPQLESLANKVDFAWINAAARRLAELESSMRRNPLRPLALDAFATSLEK